MLAALLAFSMAVPNSQAVVVPKLGLQITKSSRIKPGVYRIGSDLLEPKDAAIAIRGNDIVVDFKGVLLEGSAQTIDPDNRQGLGIYIEGKNVTIKNARVRGYKVALMAKNAPGLRILDSDFSYNWKQHLNSTPEREDTSDWMSYHQNEKDEWLRYGGAIYLRNCQNFEVKGCRVNGGQNALMMTNCDDGKVWNNDFSFNSSLGIGMYRSSNNKVMHNKIDWCVRGFSYGTYNRGQDSAGILVYEQSNKNVFAYNSVTHGGDGFFLWAGQTTMDTGKGGCNDNLLYGNDFSHAPTNGIEATFSRNVFANNLILECWHGIWGGYSYETKIVGNVFGYNAEGIAIEHGQDNSILGNSFHRDNESVVLWANDGPPDPNWGYPKHRDTRNRHTTIEGNTFTDVFTNVFRIRNAIAIQGLSNEVRASGRVAALSGKIENVTFAGNRVEGKGAGAEFPVGSVPAESNNAILIDGPFARSPKPSASSLNQGNDSDSKIYAERFKTDWNPYQFPSVAQSNPAIKALVASYRPAPLEGGNRPYLATNALRGWRYMFVDEWGPYDFKRPMIVHRGPAHDAGPGVHSMDGFSYQNFEILGPKGTWRILTMDGRPAKDIIYCCGGPSPLRGPTSSMIKIPLTHGQLQNVDIQFEFVGDPIVDHRGIVHSKGKPYRFHFQRNRVPTIWNIQWFAYDRTKIADPKSKMPTPQQILSPTELANPIAKWSIDELDIATNGSPRKGVPADGFITLAEGAFEVKPGEYEISALADDGIRLWLDDKLIIDQWHWQGPTRYAKTMKLGGKHRLRLEHYEIDGYTALKIEVAPKRS